MEWDLVCERSGLSPLFQSLYFLGAAIGEPLLGFLSDRYGRRWVLMVAGVIFSLVAVASALLPLLTLVLASRFILGLLHPSCSVAYVKAMEVCPTKQRTIMGLLITAPFAFTGMMFGAWAYLVRDWRTLQLFCTLPAVLILLQIPFMDESPRWLMVQGRVEEAAKVLHKASCWQGDALPPQQQLTDHLQKLRNQQQTVPKSKAEEYGCVAVWFKDVVLMLRQPTLRKITLALFSYSDDPFLYMVMSSLMEVPGYSGFTPIVVKFGRRPVLSSCFAISGAAILAILITPTAYTTVTLVLALVGKLFITGAYNLLYLTASELLPTCVRSRGLNLSSMMARVGSIMSPFIIGLLALTYRWLPSLMFGTFAALASLIALLLPDSRHKPLPDTTQDVEQLYGRRTEASPTLITNSESLPPLKNQEDIEQETTTQ
ncbi:Organic cation transporter protein-like 19 [Homarus americanus]|uniref:Organic cation transporter protein-like 19 n=1 Tax=Homarus americanus TaxID=6706 RepID=A0A8J5N4Y9_HOMAM|nr:Organic cation transporter protein-like 19 [Homarus americanus]